MSTVAESLPDKELATPANGAPSAAPDADDLPVTIIEPRPGWQLIDFREMWRFRELLYFLTWRDVKVRYKQTVLGAAWAILQPLATMLVFTLVLGRVPGISGGAFPYPLFVFAGLLPWIFFQTAITSAGGSVVGNQNLVTKVYFPRLMIPLAAAGPALVDLGVAFGVLIIMMFGYGLYPGWGILLVPVLVVGLTVAAVGVGTLLAALTVAYRDFRHAVPFMVQLWMFATPVIYMDPATLGPRSHRWLPLNPAYGFISSFRQAVLGESIDLYALGVSAAVSAGLLVLGCLYFRRVERNFADII